MFTDPGRSPWDLSFRILGIPVRVHPMFWLMAVILGSSSLQRGFQYLLVWVGCVFVSILIHELGHVVSARMFGVWGEVVLYGFGGLAIPAGQMRSRWQHIVVCFAGPLAGFLFLGLIIVCLPFLAPQEWVFLKNIVRVAILHLPPTEEEVVPPNPLMFSLLFDLFFINLIWGFVNLLPIWPLDGGQISRDIFTILAPRGGASFALGLSLVLAGLLAVNSLLAFQGRSILPWWVPAGGMWTFILFAWLAVGSYQALQAEQARSKWTDDHWHRWD